MTELTTLMAGRRGHFRFESGHHGELWLDLDLLFSRPARVRPHSAALGDRLAAYDVDLVCGPLLGGALVAEAVAARLDVGFAYSDRTVAGSGADRHAEYRIPEPFRGGLAGRRVAVVDDVVNAGSAVGGTIAELLRYGAVPVAIGALITLGEAPGLLAARHGLAMERVASLPSRLWSPADCPLCAAGTPVEDLS